MWAVPRTTSTALMYSFRSRSDTVVVDEPLYGHYLRISKAHHPLSCEIKKDIIQDDGNDIMRDLASSQLDKNKSVLFIKHMCHHAVGLDWGFLPDLINVFLVREPKETITSLTKIIGTPILRDTGFKQQAEIYKKVRQFDDRPLVINRADLLKTPSAVLKRICSHADISFQESMLTWEAGRKKEDNQGNDDWYHGVRQSTGFKQIKHQERFFPKELESLLAECLPYYEDVAKHAVKID